MIKVRSIGELNDELNNLEIYEIDNINVENLTINGDVSDDFSAYISFRDVLDYFDYLKDNEVDGELITLATVLKRITVEEYKELRFSQKVLYVEIHDEREVDKPETTYTDVNVNGTTYYDSTTGHIDTPDVYGRWLNGWTGAGVKLAIIDNYFENTHAPNGTLDVPYQEIVNLTGIDFPHSHGVQMGAIAGARLNGTGLVGSAPNVLLYGLNTAVYANPNQTGMSRDAIIQGLNWSVTNGMDVVSMSLSGIGYSQVYHDAVKNCVDNNIIVLAAAGNNTDGQFYKEEIRYPAGFPESLTVSALQYDEELESFVNVYNYSEVTDISCPVPQRAYRPKVSGSSTNEIFDNGTSKSLATSGATAYMAGIVATIKQQFPNIHRDECLELLLEDSIPVHKGKGRVPRLGNMDRSHFAFKRGGEWRKNKEDKFYYSGIGANQQSSRALEMINDTIRNTKLDLPASGRRSGDYLFYNWQFNDIPKFDDSILRSANYMFANTKVNGFLDLSNLKLSNILANSSINIFQNLEASSLDISGITNANVINSSIMLNGAKVESLFVANTNVASRVLNNQYLNFNPDNIGFIYVGKAGKESTYVYRYNKAGRYMLKDIAPAYSSSVTIKVYDYMEYFNSLAGKVGVNTKSEFDLFADENDRVPVQAYVPSGAQVTVRMFPAVGANRTWTLTPNSSTKKVNTQLYSDLVTSSFIPVLITAETTDGSELYFRVS